MLDAAGRRGASSSSSPSTATRSTTSTSRIAIAPRPAGGRRRDPRRHAPRGAAAGRRRRSRNDPDVPGPGRHRRRRRRRQPPARPPDGQLRPAVEPEPLEQRFGRIHRIGQTEVCHLWNLVAEETREGEVYQRLLEKLEERAEGARRPGLRRPRRGASASTPLRTLLSRPSATATSPRSRPSCDDRSIDAARSRRARASCSTERARRATRCDAADCRRIRDEMERAEARRLQPHYIECASSCEAFERLGGTAPRARAGPLRDHPRPGGDPRARPPDRHRGADRHALRADHLREGRSSRSTGRPLAEFVCPGHPLLDATIDLILERHRDLLDAGRRLVDGRAERTAPRCSSTSSTPSRTADRRDGQPRVVSRQLQFVEIDARRHGEAARASAVPRLRAARPTSTTARRRARGDLARRADLELAASWTIAIQCSARSTSTRSRRAARRSWIERGPGGRARPADQGDQLLGSRAMARQEQEQAGKKPRRATRACCQGGDAEGRRTARLGAARPKLDDAERSSRASHGRRSAVRSSSRGAAMPDDRRRCPRRRSTKRRSSGAASSACSRPSAALGRIPSSMPPEQPRLRHRSQSRDGEDSASIEVKGRIAGADDVHRDPERDPDGANRPDSYHPRDRACRPDGSDATRSATSRSPFAASSRDFGATGQASTVDDDLAQGGTPVSEAR